MGRRMHSISLLASILAAAAIAGPPPIVHRFIPFGSQRKHETASYAHRHYRLNTYRLSHPHVIVEHYTATSTFSSAYNTFAQDSPDVELHELPGTCAHFVIDRDGTIYSSCTSGSCAATRWASTTQRSASSTWACRT